jgi:hypothetical protein
VLPFTEHKPFSKGRPFRVRRDVIDHLPTSVHRMVADQFIRSGEWIIVEDES